MSGERDDPLVDYPVRGLRMTAQEMMSMAVILRNTSRPDRVRDETAALLENLCSGRWRLADESSHAVTRIHRFGPIAIATKRTFSPERISD